MHRNLAQTLVAAAVIAAGFSQPAHAGAYGEALAAAVPRHTAQRDTFTEGARSPAAETALLPVVARGNLSVCRVRGFDAGQDGMRKPDPYTDGARTGRFDVFTEGARAGTRDPYADGARSDARGSGECLS
ncbi:hypothetical protein QO239_07595 [Cupriavidus taiwanensis]|uniref:hypothetical protein n=1 Tax=Cupriavidus taiwanensis TaxID=164546 RepID=UPI002541B541|nr:hypothetical protein [Cupriavidus taiwanensis]MDK3022473.1 hypothetical protein [Cupriavidus taiwanensis]